MTVVYCYIVLYDVVFCCILQPQTWRSVVYGIMEGDEECDCCILLYCVVRCYILLYISASDMAFCGNGIVEGDEECDCCILLYCVV